MTTRKSRDQIRSRIGERRKAIEAAVIKALADYNDTGDAEAALMGLAYTVREVSA